MTIQPNMIPRDIDASASMPSHKAAPREFPVREYIGAMAVELAQMARWDGDPALGRLLDEVAALASELPAATGP